MAFFDGPREPLIIRHLGKDDPEGFTQELNKESKKKGFDVNQQWYGGFTLLRFAAQSDSIKCAKLLIERGADVDNRRKGSPIIHTAAVVSEWDRRDRRTKVLQHLLDLGVDPNLQNDIGETPLHEALGHNNTEAVRLLLDRGADHSKQDNYGNAPLHVARNVSCMELLLDRGADLHVQNSRGYTPLHAADTASCVKLLLVRGANPDIQNNAGNTPLHLHLPRPELCIEHLLHHGADLDIHNSSGWTPLDAAKGVYIYPHIVRLIQRYQLCRQQRVQTLLKHAAEARDVTAADIGGVNSMTWVKALHQMWPHRAALRAGAKAW